MIGQKGLPATFGGIERHVEEIGSRLVARGHEVTVFCRSNYAGDGQDVFRGMRLRHLPTVATKHLDAIAHSAVATVVALREPYDVIHYHAEGPGILAFLPRVASSAKVVLTVHGLDHDRPKWNRNARALLRMAGWLSARVPDATITVSRDLTEFYARHHGRTTVHIPNGAPRSRRTRGNAPEFGVEPAKYLLFVGRLVPEKQPQLLIRAFRSIPGDLKLVIAGGESYTTSYVEHLKRVARDDERVVFTGYVFGEELAWLYENAVAFVLPSSLEGLPLTLLEAIGASTPVVVSDIAPHLEIVGSDGPGHRVFPSDDVDALRSTLIAALAHPNQERVGIAVLRERVLREYSWDSAADATERLYRALVESRERPRRRPFRPSRPAGEPVSQPRAA